MSKTANGQQGFILRNRQGEFVFRVYHAKDSETRFTDYEIAVEDLQVEILSKNVEFSESPAGKRLVYITPYSQIEASADE